MGLLRGKGDAAKEKLKAQAVKGIEKVLKLPETDERKIYPEIEDLSKAAAAGDWVGVRELLGRCEHELDRSFAGSHIVDYFGVEAMLQTAVADDPDDPTPLGLLGAVMVTQGWEIRGGGYASTVGADEFDAFHKHLRKAEAIFLDVLARDPGNTDAGRWRLDSGRGLRVGLQEITRRYEQYVAHHPHSYGAQSRMLEALCPKWYGTWEAASAFVRKCVKEAPPGGFNGGLVPALHFERWMAADSQPPEEYFRYPHVREQILWGAEASVLHPDYEGHLGWADLHGMFAWAFAMGGDHALAAEQFTRLDNCRSGGFWDYFPNPDGMYNEQRSRSTQMVAQYGR